MIVAPVSQNQPLIARISGLLRREFVFALLISAMIGVLSVLSNQVLGRMETLRSAPHDNVQWNVAQLDVELLALANASHQAEAGRPGSLSELRQRFDIYFSRVRTIGNMPLFTEKLVQSESIRNLAHIKSILDKTALTIDAPDEKLMAQLHLVSAATEAMRPLTRQIGLDGVRVYAAQSDTKRDEFAKLLGQTAIVNGFLIVALGTVLLFLMHQIRISRKRAADLEVVSDRNASTVNSALDAIIAVDMDGTIVEFNPAASRIFGYSRNAAIGAKFEDLVVPERFRTQHREAMTRFKRGQKQFSNDGRVEMFALRSDGSEFPVELSLGITNAFGSNLVIVFLRDISQRVEQEKALRAARDEALEAAKTKSQFLAIMSHEMRTPLNGVMAILDLLDATKLNEKQKTYVKTATTSAEILKQHVDDVLDLTRIQSGKLEFFPRTFNLAEMLEEIETINQATAAARGNKIALTVDMPQPYFVADRKRIHQVLTNLVGNAIKFTENGRITITTRFTNVRADVVDVTFSVSDTGVGIAEAQQTRIFEDFVTVDATYQRSSAGAGLGLPICKSIVEALGGEIGVKSKPGEGATFWFKLPLKAAFADECELGNVKDQRPLVIAHRRLKVLVVEDNETNRFVAGEMLEAAHCDVVFAPDGQAGTQQAMDHHFDLIFMDLSMPKMNGWDAARFIRSNASAKSHGTPIYALTAHAMPEEQKAVLDAGMQGCILKPLRARQLHDVLAVMRANLGETDELVQDAEVHDALSVDRAVLEELREVLGQETFEDHLSRFLREARLIKEHLNQKAEANDWDDLAKQAHKFAGSAAIFGAVQLAQKLREIETAAKSKSQEVVSEKLTEVGALSGKVGSDYTHFLTL